MELNFTNILWAGIGAVELFLVIARIFLHPGPVRLTMALAIPGLIILGAVANAIYNRFTIGHMLEPPPPPRSAARQ